MILEARPREDIVYYSVVRNISSDAAQDQRLTRGSTGRVTFKEQIINRYRNIKVK